MRVRAKMALTEVREVKWSVHHEAQRTLVFTSQYDTTIPEDRRFQKATPSARAEFQIDNPEAVKQFELGKAYYFDFTPVEESE